MSHRSKKFLEQRILGIILILLSVFMFAIASSGANLEDRDGGAIILLLPLGLWLLFSRRIVIY